jgi:hypothetical protein
MLLVVIACSVGRVDFLCGLFGKISDLFQVRASLDTLEHSKNELEALLKFGE